MMENITVHITRQANDKMTGLVRNGKYASRSEIIRIAIKDLLVKEGIWYEEDW